jgi:hypothetical protein
MDNRGIGVQFRIRAKYFLLYNVQTGSVIHLTSYLMVTRGYFIGDKAAGK